jgi:hypothetical protein
MSILVFALIVVLLLVLLMWAVDLLNMTPPYAAILKVLILIIGVVVIAERAGLV